MKGRLTWDQGSDMARHVALIVVTDMPVSFAHPHAPWERGSDESTGGLIREYLPKGYPHHQAINPPSPASPKNPGERPGTTRGSLAHAMPTNAPPVASTG